MITKMRQPTKAEHVPRYTRATIHEGMYLCDGAGEVRLITELMPGRYSAIEYRVIEHERQPRKVGRVEQSSISQFCGWAMFEATDLYEAAK
jgi:transposase